MSYQRNDDPGEQLGNVVTLILYLWLVFVFLLVLPALFKISVFINKAWMKLADQATNGDMTRNEGLALLLGGIGWGLGFLAFLPLTIDLELDPGRSLWILLATGAIWGLGTSYQALMEVQEEMLAKESILHFTQQSGLSADFYEPVPLYSSPNDRQGLSNEELKRRALGSRNDQQPGEAPQPVVDQGVANDHR